MAKYIDKSAVVAEIERIKKEECPTDTYEGRCKLLWFEQFSSFLDTLEVKEVDLEKEIDDYINEHFSECGDGVLISDANSTELTLLDVMPMARHFYELGLKTQKGE